MNRDPTFVQDEMQLAKAAAESLERTLPQEPGRDRRIHDLYIPIYSWLSRALEESRQRPLVVGFCAPQGSGKSTLSNHLVALFAARGIRAATVSIDDFYLRHSEQKALEAAYPDNPYLKYRGYPGTHDVSLGSETLQMLQKLDTPRIVRMPTYDKSAYAGRGDRLPESQWRLVEGPLDLIILEGWMLGFQPLAKSMVESFGDENILEVNRRLEAYEAWSSQLQRMIFWQADDLEQIVHWRMDAEARSVAAGRPALDQAAIEDYIRRCIPAYWLYADSVVHSRWAPERQLAFRLDAARLPVLETASW